MNDFFNKKSLDLNLNKRDVKGMKYCFNPRWGILYPCNNKATATSQGGAS